MKKKKLNKEQKAKIGIVLAWYNLYWAMADQKREEDQKKANEKACKMIEDIILN